MSDSSIRPFIYKVCNNVLPLVYDDALSYNDLVNKMICKVNEVIGVTNELILTSERVVNTINDLVRDYFDSDEYHELVERLVGEDVEDVLSGLADWETLCEQGRKIKIVAGVIRGDSTGWHFIADGTHSEVGFNGVSVNEANNQLELTYNFTPRKILGFIVTPDEVYVSNGVFVGASVGIDKTILKTYKQSTIGGLITYNGSSWVLSNAEGVTDASMNSQGILTITHNNANGFKASVTPRWGTAGINATTYIPSIESLSTTITQVVFRKLVVDTTSQATEQVVKSRVVTTPDTNMKIFVERFTNPAPINPNDIKLAMSDFWIIGVFEMA